MAPHFNKKCRVSTVSVVPEYATVASRFYFTLIGADAEKLSASIMTADMYTEMATLMAKGGDEKIAEDGENGFSCIAPNGMAGDNTGSDTLQNPYGIGHEGTTVSTSSFVPKDPAERSMFAMIDEDEMHVARIYLNRVAGFSTAMRKLKDEDAVRNTCFLFLVDSRLDMEKKVSPIFNQAFAEMHFMYGDLANKAKSHKMPALRTLLLTHSQNATGERVLPPNEVGEIKTMSKRLADATKGCGLRNHHVEVDFDSADAIFSCLQEIARDMHRLNSAKGVFTRIFRTTSMNKRNRKCGNCIIQ